MKHIFFFFLSLLSLAFAGPLLETIKDIEELSTLNSIINRSANLTALLKGVKDFTFIAPSNNAFEKWLARDESVGTGVLEMMLRYHLLHGRFTIESFNEEPQFAHSFLENSTYTNVTGGQVVELTRINDEPVILSGNKTVSNIALPADRICTGGYVQVTDFMLELPKDLITSISEFGLNNFIAVLNAGGFVSQDDSPVIRQVLRASDMTFFAPNTQKAIKSMDEVAKNMNETQLTGILGYHLVPRLLYSSDLKDGMRLKTLQGSDLLVTVLDGETYINSAKMLTSDYLIGNGVIHSIDNLLDSSKPGPPENSTTSEQEGTEDEKPKSTGMSAGAKAGIAIGVIAVVLLILVLVFLLNRRRRMRREGEEDTTRAIEAKDYSQETGYHQSAGGHQHGNYGPRLHVDEIELDTNSNRNSLTASQKKWEYEVNAVELDGTGTR